MAINGGAAAVALDGMPVDRQSALAADMLARIYPGRFRAPVAAQASGWWADEFSRGLIFVHRGGLRAEDQAALAEPVSDRLWFAGEAVHPELHSTVHGAW